MARKDIMKLTPKLHNRPPHLLTDNSFYFITSRTLDAQWFLQPNQYKQIVLDTIYSKVDKFDIGLIAFAILQNHIHLMLTVKDGQKIPKFMQEINGASSFAINKADGVKGRKIWWNYYDHVIRSDADFYKHLNYIHQNPIKHKLAKDFDYEFSSYKQWLEKRGKEYLDEAFQKYPVVDFVIQNDEF